MPRGARHELVSEIRILTILHFLAPVLKYHKPTRGGRKRGNLFASMPIACYRSVMANIQVKNVPEGLHNKLRRYAREQEITISDFVLEAIEREVARRDWHKRFISRPTTRLRNTAAQLLEQERRLRDSNLS